jgi:hypothetical protein
VQERGGFDPARIGRRNQAKRHQSLVRRNPPGLPVPRPQERLPPEFLDQSQRTRPIAPRQTPDLRLQRAAGDVGIERAVRDPAPRRGRFLQASRVFEPDSRLPVRKPGSRFGRRRGRRRRIHGFSVVPENEDGVRQMQLGGKAFEPSLGRAGHSVDIRCPRFPSRFEPLQPDAQLPPVRFRKLLVCDIPLVVDRLVHS